MHRRRETAVRSVQVNREKFGEIEKMLPFAQTEASVKALANLATRYPAMAQFNPVQAWIC
jgi:hypothetical protein